MLLNIYDPKIPADKPVRLALHSDCGNINLNIVDENGFEICTILTLCFASKDIFLRCGVGGYGFKTDNQDRVKIRKENK